MAHVKLVNVSKKYDGVNEVVKSLNLEIKEKEFVVLVGPSGCGKSTTLRMIAGLEDITDGELFIDNKLMNNIKPKDRDIAMVFQNYALYPHMTVYENMAFGLKLRKLSKHEIEQRVMRVAEILGLEDLLLRKPKALSGGQRQRVALGRAIVRNPKVFLFDEPLSNLDAKLRVQMRTEISRLHKSLEATIVYVTHDQIEAMTLGDMIVVMKDGVIQQSGSPLKLYNYPKNKFVAEFIGSPAMNFVSGIISNEYEFVSNTETLRFILNDLMKQKLKSYANQGIILGIRPEDIILYNAKNEINFKTKVELIEPMGNESFVYFKLNNNLCVMRTKQMHHSELNKTIEFGINSSNIHFFDKQNELCVF